MSIINVINIVLIAPLKYQIFFFILNRLIMVFQTNENTGMLVKTNIKKRKKGFTVIVFGR